MTTDTDRQNRTAVAMTILDQIGWAAKAGLGYHNPAITEHGVAFKARILPLRKDGSRGDRPRNMLVEIDLNGCDLYEIRVSHTFGKTVTTHYASDTGAMGYDARQMRAIMYALDSDQWHDPINWDRYFQCN